MTFCPWRQLDHEAFRAAILSSALRCSDRWLECTNNDKLAQLYDNEITTILDTLIPIRTVTCRRRPSDPWFDQDCRAAKRRVRALERKYRRADSTETASVAAADVAWRSERRAYRQLLQQKREDFWRSKVESERSYPRRLWRSVDTLLGRGRVSMTDSIDAVSLHKFFDDKVDGVRTATANAPPPTDVHPSSAGMHLGGVRVDHCRRCCCCCQRVA